MLFPRNLFALWSANATSFTLGPNFAASLFCRRPPRQYLPCRAYRGIESSENGALVYTFFSMPLGICNLSESFLPISHFFSLLFRNIAEAQRLVTFEDDLLRTIATRRDSHWSAIGVRMLPCIAVCAFVCVETRGVRLSRVCIRLCKDKANEARVLP